MHVAEGGSGPGAREIAQKTNPRERLLRATAACLESGLRPPSIPHLLQLAGISRSALYQQFHSIDALPQAVAAAWLQGRLLPAKLPTSSPAWARSLAEHLCSVDQRNLAMDYATFLGASWPHAPWIRDASFMALRAVARESIQTVDATDRNERISFEAPAAVLFTGLGTIGSIYACAPEGLSRKWEWEARKWINGMLRRSPCDTTPHC